VGERRRERKIESVGREGVWWGCGTNEEFALGRGSTLQWWVSSRYCVDTASFFHFVGTLWIDMHACRRRFIANSLYID
jgi:hypothetical protein